MLKSASFITKISYLINSVYPKAFAFSLLNFQNKDLFFPALDEIISAWYFWPHLFSSQQLGL